MPPVASGLLPRFGTYAQLQLVSVVVPGSLILLELWMAAVGPRENDDFLAIATRQTRDIGDWPLAMATILFAMVAYALGLFGRQLAWALVRTCDSDDIEGGDDRVVERSRVRTFAASLLVPRPRRLTGPQIVERLANAYGADALKGALVGHAALEDALTRMEQGPARSYAKLWLRERHPVLGINHHEFEINAFIAIIWPILLLPPALALQLDWWREHAWATGLGLVAAAFIAILGARACLLHAQSRRRDEGIDAFRHFCIARWIEDGAERNASVTPTT